MNTGTSRSGSTSRVSLVHMVGSQAGLQDGGDGNRNSHHDQDIESDAKDENAHIRVHSTLGGDTFTTPDEVQTTGQ